MVKISAILLFVVIIISIITVYSLTPKLDLETDEVTINVFDDYNSISYNATSLGKDVSDEVVVDGNVDNQNIGKYVITYTIKNSFFKTTKKLTVNVIDKVPPEIDLIGSNEYYVCSMDNFIEPGYTALDNYDGDITSNVIYNKIDDENIEYKVSDASNNETKITRKIIAKDITAPEITLKGNEKVTITKGSKYKDKGAIASDNCDGDITKGIETSGSVDTSNVGTYEIKYSSKDSSGNTSEITRTVIVQDEKKKDTSNESNNSVNNTSGVIYLTFDDGPGSSTPLILDTLKKHDIKATFFVTLAGSDNVLKREYDEGHTIALHTATHVYKKIYASIDAYFEDLNAVANRVKNVTGLDTKFIRFPGGTSNHVSAVGMSNIVREVTARGYTYFDWNVSVEDAGECAYKKNKQSCVLNNFKKYLKPNRVNIVLMHDIKSYTAAALDDMINYAKSNNYTFKQIDSSTEPIQYKPYK